MTISMGAKAQDNAFAERANGVIKNEYLIPWEPGSFRELSRLCRQAVEDYNTTRHHGALGRRSPIEYENDLRQGSSGNRKAEMIRSGRTPKNLEGTLQKIPVDTGNQYPYCVFQAN